ncbi:putative 4phosphopantetheinyl transferase [Phaeomoniella chlamydospora]|uniref:holo-[acyl-carrier-protein] synthase n=1 Tax=Phaeomoniella chlamydospora TaxID=158046 RepID=A0A0G2H508_PHACM|nr:putative 4phosphopantetheinyl transferase [Phaeomoniella chlamydospora]
MSLSSALLKFWFIHRTVRIPWSEIQISRTPDPHKRPYWDPSTSQTVSDRLAKNSTTPNLEFNVSHQAGLVGLAGTVLPPGSAPPLTVSTAHGATTTTSSLDPAPIQSSTQVTVPASIRLGLDITSPAESKRQPTLNKPQDLYDWVEIFSEVFHPLEIDHMKFAPISQHGQSSTSTRNSDAEPLFAKLRRFYAFFALKEAYVKMTGEALLAKWLRDVEFKNVEVPAEIEEGWGHSELGTEVWYQGTRVEGVQMVSRAWGKEFIVSLAIDGNAKVEDQKWKLLDWKNDIEQCATGACSCLG